MIEIERGVRMPPIRTLVHCLLALVVSLVLCASIYNYKLRQGLSEEELHLTLSVQRTLDRVTLPGRSSTWLKIEDGRLHAIVTLDPASQDQPERLRPALESLLSVDLARGDRLDLVGVPGHRAPSFAREWRLSVGLFYGSAVLAFLCLAAVVPLTRPAPASPAWLAWASRIGFGVVALGLPLWALIYGGLTSLPQILAAAVLLAVLGRPWRVPRLAMPTAFKLSALMLVAGVLYTWGEGPNAQLRRQIGERLGAPAWVVAARRGDRWGAVAAVRVSPGDVAPALRLGQLETAARQSLPGVRLSLLGVQAGLPRGPWRLIALNLLGIAALWWAVNRRQTRALLPASPPPAPEPVVAPAAPEPPPVKKPESVVSLMQVDIFCVEVGRGLIPLVDPKQGAKLLERVTAIRRHLAVDLGVVLPGVRFRDNLMLEADEYRISLRGVEVGRGRVQMGHLLAIGPADKLAAFGEVIADPTYGMPGVWITSEPRREAERLGCMLFDPVSVIATQLTELARRNASRLVNLQETRALLDTLRKTHPVVVELAELRLGLMLIWEVLQALLAEGVSIRDLELILTSMLRSGSYAVEALVEVCRDELAAHICQSLLNGNRELMATELPEEVERLLRRAPDGVLDPEDANQALAILRDEALRFQEAGRQPVFLTPPGLRLYLRRLTERMTPEVVCLSWTQVAPGITLKEPPVQV